MESKNKIQAIAEQIETKLIESDKVKDELHSISREIIKFSGQSIEGLHRKDINQAKEKLVSIENLLIQLNKYLMKESHYKYTGIVNVALQEYVEAKLFYFTILNKPFPTSKTILFYNLEQTLSNSGRASSNRTSIFVRCCRPYR
ncbi:MAG: hypothetical protein ACTSRO_10110 [Candidatus Heimdallarchaeaceae archaeon]